MPKESKLSVNVNNSSILTASNCTTAVIREYFQYILHLSKSGETFPVNLDDIFFLAYSRKDAALRALTSDETFIEGLDYKPFHRNVERSSNGCFNGSDKVTYKLSIPCLEFFIARKVRPVFEVYRQVFHQVPEVMDKVLNKVRDDKSKIAKLEKRVESLERQIKIVQSISKYETELKNSCFSYLVYTGQYLKWEEYRKGDISKEDLKLLKAI